MTLHVYTARKWLQWADMLDVTRLGKDPLGIAFAPSWHLLKAGKGWGEPPLPFARFAELYTAEMRVCYGMNPEHPRAGPDDRLAWTRGVRPRREAWDEVMGRETVGLGCYEEDAAACHRSVLAGIFVRLGAVYDGEMALPERAI